jgi:hypothetical protein
MRLEAIGFWLGVKKFANTCFGLDLIGRNPRFKFRGIAAIALARGVLGEFPEQPRIVAQRLVAGLRVGCGEGKDYESRSRYIDRFPKASSSL